MNAPTDRLAFAPPPPPGMLRAFALAVAAHLLLVLALMYGLQWQRDSQVVAAEAELWSAVPQEAAPREVPAPPQPPQPEPKPAPRVEAPPNRDADIAAEREKREQEKREAAERRQAELERDRQRKLEAQRKKEEQEAQRKKEQEEARVAEAKRKADAEKKRLQEQQEAARVAKLREDNLKRMQAMAGGGSGSPSATGQAARASGPSASYAGRIAALIKSNTRFTDTVEGNPAVEVEIRLAPDGTIVGQRVIKSSGNRQRDEAVLRGIEATNRIPRDTDGRIFTPMVVSVRQ